MKTLKKIIFVLLIGASLLQFYTVIAPKFSSYIDPWYTEEMYSYLENTFNNSQYRLKNPSSIMPDETLFRYASAAYIKGVDPIYINSEHTPLGKYILGTSVYFFHSDGVVILFFGLGSIILLWLLSLQVLSNKELAILPPVFLVLERVFTDQFLVIPLLDIIQLPFILLALYVFNIENKKKNFFWTALVIGIVMSVKTPIAGVLLVGTFGLYFVILRLWKVLIRFVLFLPISIVPLILSYTKTFLDGYSMLQFIGFMKWIILYQKGKLEYPFSAWRLVYLNQWQTWWGDRSYLHAVDWQISWPIFTSVALIVCIFVAARKMKAKSPLIVLLLWFVVYGAFLSIGVISSRFFLPFLPVAYIISVYGVNRVITYLRKVTK